MYRVATWSGNQELSGKTKKKDKFVKSKVNFFKKHQILSVQI